MTILRRMRKHTDTILSVSAITIAFASICISLWEGSETRRHNRLSVRPKLEVVFNAGKETFGYTVDNNGLGPAMITGMDLFVDGEKIRHTGFGGLDEFLDMMKLKERFLSRDAFGKGITLTAGSRKSILLFKKFNSDNTEELLKNIYLRVKIEITYASMYDEPFKCRFP
jgi:hypothetical protein